MNTSISKISKFLEVLARYDPKQIHPNDDSFIELFVNLLNVNSDPENIEVIIQNIRQVGFGTVITVTISDISNDHLFGFEIAYNKQHIVVKMVSSNKHNVVFQVRPYIDLNTLEPKKFCYVYYSWKEFLRTKLSI